VQKNIFGNIAGMFSGSAKIKELEAKVKELEESNSSLHNNTMMMALAMNDISLYWRR